MKHTKADIVLKVVLAIGGLQFLVCGFWSYFWPSSFYSTIATFPPFNLHLFHDLGAFQLAVGAGSLACLVWTDVLLVGLFAGAVGTVTHAISHLVDRDLGGGPSDPYTTGALALLLLCAFIARAISYRSARRGSA
ncbi:hypothetical protein AB0I28_31355 [Phytomonospora sp. NPDC050363]|uniref:hypothetical protein n=1 Tax=Phytomonospora sp. NPDC050363 TaxID=3155642 RepID=UPI003404B95F